jgi:hypothetical protein
MHKVKLVGAETFQTVAATYRPSLIDLGKGGPLLVSPRGTGGKEMSSTTAAHPQEGFRGIIVNRSQLNIHA